MKMLSRCIKPLLYLKGEYIVRKGDIGSEVSEIWLYYNFQPGPILPLVWKCETNSRPVLSIRHDMHTSQDIEKLNNMVSNRLCMPKIEIGKSSNPGGITSLRVPRAYKGVNPGLTRIYLICYCLRHFVSSSLLAIVWPYNPARPELPFDLYTLSWLIIESRIH